MKCFVKISGIIVLLFFLIKGIYDEEVYQHSWKKNEEYPILPILEGDTLVIGLKTNSTVNYAFIKKQDCICPRESNIEKTEIIKKDTIPSFVSYIKKLGYSQFFGIEYEVKYKLIVPHKVKLVEISDFYLDSIISIKRGEIKEKKIQKAYQNFNKHS